MMKILNLKDVRDRVGSHWSLLSCIYVGDTAEKAAGLPTYSWNSVWVEGSGRFLTRVLTVHHLPYGIVY